MNILRCCRPTPPDDRDTVKIIRVANPLPASDLERTVPNCFNDFVTGGTVASVTPQSTIRGNPWATEPPVYANFSDINRASSVYDSNLILSLDTVVELQNDTVSYPPYHANTPTELKDMDIKHEDDTVACAPYYGYPAESEDTENTLQDTTYPPNFGNPAEREYTIVKLQNDTVNYPPHYDEPPPRHENTVVELQEDIAAHPSYYGYTPTQHEYTVDKLRNDTVIHSPHYDEYSLHRVDSTATVFSNDSREDVTNYPPEKQESESHYDEIEDNSMLAQDEDRTCADVVEELVNAVANQLSHDDQETPTFEVNYYDHSWDQASAPSRPAPAQNRNIASPTKESYAVVLYPYTGTQFDELTCEAGDKVLLKREVDDQWIYGMNTRTGLHGIVPIGYLDVKVPMAPTQSAQGSSTIKSTYNPNADDGFVYPYSDSALNITTALYDYNSTESGDLSFHAGDPLCIIEWINDDWLRGECAGRKGIFPANFVDLSTLGTIPRSTPSGSTAGQAGAKETVTVAYDYDSGVADDLVCRAGDVLEVVEHVNAEWIKARSHGKIGLVPTTYLQMSSGSATVSKSVQMEKEMTAVADYTSTEAGHLVASKGDKILIVEKVDEHWYRGKLADSAFRRMPPGLIPKSFVQ